MARSKGVDRQDFIPIAGTLVTYVDEKLEEDSKKELEKYFPSTTEQREMFLWNLDKLKILLLLREPRSSDILEKILSCLEPV